MSKNVQLPILTPPHPVADIDQHTYFEERSAAVAGDMRHRQVLRKAVNNYGVAYVKGRDRFLDHESARTVAATIKRDAIEHLDQYLLEFECNFTANGGKVHWAADADDARRIICDIAKQAGIKFLVKSKSMATEEVHLNEALLEVGVEPIETDLGEFICQIRQEPPYHIVTPVMHLTKDDISQTFHDVLHLPKTDVAEELALQAREILREKFVTATMGITGGNFLIADVGGIAITENEGNARLSFSMPDIHVALVGIEKMLPRMDDLALFWPLLATSGTGQHVTCYNSVVMGPRKPGELDGPRECHVVLMDNGRTKLLADPEQRESLQCIRCGACLNVCPIFRNVGGHTYGTTYQGPIGSIITPHLKELKDWKHLPYASSLCGRCSEVCPVRIDIHHHLLHNRRNAVAAGFGNKWERFAFKNWLWSMKSLTRYRWSAWLGKKGMWWFRTLGFQNRTLGNPVRGWTKTRELPNWPNESFRDWWAREGGK